MVDFLQLHKDAAFDTFLEAGEEPHWGRRLRCEEVNADFLVPYWV